MSANPAAASAAATATPGSPTAAANLKFVSQLLDSRQAGYSLPGPFYTDALMYEQDLKSMWHKAWLSVWKEERQAQSPPRASERCEFGKLTDARCSSSPLLVCRFAGYSLQLKKPGDYFTYEVGADSIIVIRSAAATSTHSGIRAFHNSCRHRGSRIVPASQDTKQTKRLVCPYHQWSYDRDGALVNARDMDADFNKAQNGLHEVHAEEVEGLVFICLTPKHEKPMWPFEPARSLMAPQLAPHELTNAKIAFSANYSINANWKLVYENNRECYHCAGSHPEYVKSNYDLHLTYRENADGTRTRDLDPHYPGKEKVLEYINEKSKSWEALGFQCSPDSSFPGDGWYRASRMPLKQGWVTESIDGQPVSTIMGRLPQRDMGSFRIHTLPNVRRERHLLRLVFEGGGDSDAVLKS